MKKKGVVFFKKSFYNSSSLLDANQQIFKSFNLNVSNHGLPWHSTILRLRLILPLWFVFFGYMSSVGC